MVDPTQNAADAQNTRNAKGRQAVRLLLLEDRISDPGAVSRCMHALGYGHVGTSAAGAAAGCALHSPLSTYCCAMLKVKSDAPHQARATLAATAAVSMKSKTTLFRCSPR
jgi:hypothetical protein